MKTQEAKDYFNKYYFANEDSVSLESAFFEGIKYASKKEDPNTCCGSCKTFKFEDLDGDGICGISQFAKNCKEGTDCKLYKQLKKK